MSITVEAVHENGCLRLSQPVPLKDQEKVLVTVHTGGTWVERTAGMMGFNGTAEEAEYFALSPELDPQESR